MMVATCLALFWFWCSGDWSLPPTLALEEMTLKLSPQTQGTTKVSLCRDTHLSGGEERATAQNSSYCTKFMTELIAIFFRKPSVNRNSVWTHSFDRIRWQPNSSCLLILSLVINDNYKLITMCTN